MLVRLVVVLSGALVTLLLGHVALEPAYAHFWEGVLASGGGGNDDQNRLSMFIVFVEVPVLLILGGLLADRLYKKFVSRRKKDMNE